MGFRLHVSYELFYCRTVQAVRVLTCMRLSQTQVLLPIYFGATLLREQFLVSFG